MKKQWKMIEGIMLAVGLLMGCGSQPGNIQGAELLTATAETFRDRLDAPGEESEQAIGFAAENTDALQSTPTRQTALEEGTHGTQEGEPDEGIREFAYKLMTEALTKSEQENPVLSPVSAYLALSMAATGARGETKAELESLLGEEHRQLSERCMMILQSRAEIELELANSAWLDRRLRAKEEWLAGIQEVYRGEVYRAELNSRQTMKAINTWAKEHTQGLVKDFLPRPLPEDARLALLNALYLEADWRSSFDGYATRRQTWYREDGEEKQVQTMHKGMVYFEYVSDADMDGVVLPFVGEELAFLAIRPQAGQTARELYGQLTPGRTADLLQGREERLMNLSLPKFTVSCDQELNELLQDLGVEKAFDPGLADFSDLGTDEAGQPLYVSLVRQKAVIELNEEGVKAGAVTVVEMRAGSGMPAEEPVEMNLDHPFVYMILDMETQVPLFVGILDEPG